MEPLIILGVIVVVAVVAVVALHKHPATPVVVPKDTPKVDPQPDKGKDEHDKEKKN